MIHVTKQCHQMFFARLLVFLVIFWSNGFQGIGSFNFCYRQNIQKTNFCLSMEKLSILNYTVKLMYMLEQNFPCWMKWNGAFLFERQQTVFRSFAPAPIPQRVSISLLLYNKEWNTPPPLAAKKLSLLNNGSPQEILLLVVAKDTYINKRGCT